MLRMYSCCIMVMTSGLRFTSNCTTYTGSVSIFFGLSGLMVHFFFALATVYVCCDHYLALFLRTFRRFREVREVGRVSVSSSRWRAPLRRARVFEHTPPFDPHQAP